MMIPTISIDGLSGSVVRDGPGITLAQAMSLDMLVGQNKACGEAFEAAVEKFQQAMAEGLSEESGISSDETSEYVASVVSHVVVETTVETAVKVGTTGTIRTTETTRTMATAPLEGVAEKTVMVEKVVTPVVVEVPTATVEVPTATVEVPTATVEVPTAAIEVPVAAIEVPVAVATLFLRLRVGVQLPLTRIEFHLRHLAGMPGRDEVFPRPVFAHHADAQHALECVCHYETTCFSFAIVSS